MPIIAPPGTISLPFGHFEGYSRSVLPINATAGFRRRTDSGACESQREASCHVDIPL